MNACPPVAIELYNACLKAGRVLLTGPVKPDGDSLGACLAFQQVLVRQGITCDVAGEATFQYQRLPGVDALVPDSQLGGDYDVVIVMDGDRHRLTTEALACFERANQTGIVDHHASTTPDGYDYPWIQPKTGSTCEMVYQLLRTLDLPLDHDLAANLYAGVIFDTGAFRYSNTLPDTHRMAADLLTHRIDHAGLCLDVLMDRRTSGLRLAGRVFSEATELLDGRLMVGVVSKALQTELGVMPGDLEGLAEGLLHVRGVEVGVVVIQTDATHVKLSFRSRGKVDVSAVAHDLHPSGGGHFKAAGVRFESEPEPVVPEVERLVAERLGRS